MASLDEMTISRLIEVRTGKAVSFGNGKVASAINKTPRNGPMLVRRLGLEGDEQADHRFHGGSDKAVLHYAADNYDVWRSEDPEFSELFVPGAFGENFVSYGLDETNVCLGDVFRIGAVEVEAPNLASLASSSISGSIKLTCRAGFKQLDAQDGTTAFFPKARL